ncbi:hypothetical protein FHS57_001530 [Runella defluvii]|uniref:Uncharacterized protein n=1 Tax=Runella defluvii TaxID=370973 RepID=A0A7W5ZKP7_9BACT|nr:hypothetical protein [Runella defluvii]
MSTQANCMLINGFYFAIPNTQNNTILIWMLLRLWLVFNTLNHVLKSSNS